MYKMNKTFNFHISKEEKQAIEILRKNDINISRFLRRCLRELSEKLRWQHEGDDKKY